MNPNAKEFVPAHILKRRQEESVNQLAEQVGQVDIVDNAESKDTPQTNSTMTDNSASTTTTTTTVNISTTTKTTTTKPSENGQTSKLGGDSTDYQHTNGTNKKTDLEDDRYLLKGGEAFCEFNGEQFIIPGEDDEYDEPSEPSDPEMYAREGGFDFGNPEDNEDEDVCNAYEQFLDNLPE